MSYSRCSRCSHCSRCSRHSSRWWRQWRSWAPKNFQAVGTCHTCGRAARSSCEISHLPLSPWVYPRFQGWYIQCLSYVCHVYLYFKVHTMYLQVCPKLGYHWPHLHCLVRQHFPDFASLLRQRAAAPGTPQKNMLVSLFESKDGVNFPIKRGDFP